MAPYDFNELAAQLGVQIRPSQPLGVRPAPPATTVADLADALGVGGGQSHETPSNASGTVARTRPMTFQELAHRAAAFMGVDGGAVVEHADALQPTYPSEYHGVKGRSVPIEVEAWEPRGDAFLDHW
ncbi:hypothetical protein BOTBODRAFT_182443 [Botryobasidium botryosum FD-172 SS1]|uniref:Uncharacterized protein n=1 Tax=Botryobasidium botryosum (strain FD-172 SS1) TaxID=930990 RepID=A0A067LTK1_BOTB1|nr:hypothetical protein BOTBODRAFT_182443 [Botryobasidium botryosum FD-172 SS1]